MKPRKIAPVLLGCLWVFFIASCTKQNGAEPQINSIAVMINTNANFSTLRAAVTKAGMGSLLVSGTLTFFAPDNEAFAASGITMASLNELTATQLSDILHYHILNTKLTASFIPLSDTMVTLHGRNIFVSKNANGLFANGLKLKTSDVQVANGVIHVIEKVMTPPQLTIKEIVTANTNLSLFAVALTKAGLSDTLSRKGKYTVFAPTNAAFQAAGLGTTAAIQAAPAATIATMIKYHILTTHFFLSDFINNTTVTSFQGGSLKIGTLPSSVKINSSSAVASNFVMAGGINLVATNGVIHIIDKVMIP